MKASTRKRFLSQIPGCLEIGDRFLVSFEDPELEVKSYQGRLQDLSKDGFLCIDAPGKLRPKRGTAVKVSSIRNDNAGDFSFSSEIRGRRRLRGRLPVILLRPPASVEPAQRRTAYRIAVCMKSQVQMLENATAETLTKTAVVTNLSGGGAQVFIRHRPDTSTLKLTLDPPDAFLEAQVKRKWARSGLSRRKLAILGEPTDLELNRLRDRLALIEVRIVDSRIHLQDAKGTIYAISIAFAEPREECYQLVRFLERQAIRRGLGADTRPEDADDSDRLTAIPSRPAGGLRPAAMTREHVAAAA